MLWLQRIFTVLLLAVVVTGCSSTQIVTRGDDGPSIGIGGAKDAISEGSDCRSMCVADDFTHRSTDDANLSVDVNNAERPNVKITGHGGCSCRGVKDVPIGGGQSAVPPLPEPEPVPVTPPTAPSAPEVVETLLTS